MSHSSCNTSSAALCSCCEKLKQLNDPVDKHDKCIRHAPCTNGQLLKPSTCGVCVSLKQEALKGKTKAKKILNARFHKVLYNRKAKMDEAQAFRCFESQAEMDAWNIPALNCSWLKAAHAPPSPPGSRVRSTPKPGPKPRSSPAARRAHSVPAVPSPGSFEGWSSVSARPVSAQHLTAAYVAALNPAPSELNPDDSASNVSSRVSVSSSFLRNQSKQIAELNAQLAAARQSASVSAPSQCASKRRPSLESVQSSAQDARSSCSPAKVARRSPSPDVRPRVNVVRRGSMSSSYSPRHASLDVGSPVAARVASSPPVTPRRQVTSESEQPPLRPVLRDQTAPGPSGYKAPTRSDTAAPAVSAPSQGGQPARISELLRPIASVLSVIDSDSAFDAETDLSAPAGSSPIKDTVSQVVANKSARKNFLASFEGRAKEEIDFVLEQSRLHKSSLAELPPDEGSDTMQELKRLIRAQDRQESDVPPASVSVRWYVPPRSAVVVPGPRTVLIWRNITFVDQEHLVLKESSPENFTFTPLSLTSAAMGNLLDVSRQVALDPASLGTPALHKFNILKKPFDRIVKAHNLTFYKDRFARFPETTEACQGIFLAAEDKFAEEKIVKDLDLARLVCKAGLPETEDQRHWGFLFESPPEFKLNRVDPPLQQKLSTPSSSLLKDDLLLRKQASAQMTGLTLGQAAIAELKSMARAAEQQVPIRPSHLSDLAESLEEIFTFFTPGATHFMHKALQGREKIRKEVARKLPEDLRRKLLKQDPLARDLFSKTALETTNEAVVEALPAQRKELEARRLSQLRARAASAQASRGFRSLAQRSYRISRAASRARGWWRGRGFQHSAPPASTPTPPTRTAQPFRGRFTPRGGGRPGGRKSVSRGFKRGSR